MSASELSSLSSAESVVSDEDIRDAKERKGPIDSYFKTSKPEAPTKKKRAPSPPHEYVLADNPDIAFIVMFRARFHTVFPRSLPHLGPQDIESGIVDAQPSENVEKLLCALIGLVLNRKKDVERGHYGRALEEAVHNNITQWPVSWDAQNPLHGGTTFNSMTPEQRLSLLKALILWSLNASEAVVAFLKDSYKQNRHEDDLNQPLSVQSWGRDGDKRRYWLVEGQDDTHFRLYRESNPALKTSTWRSVADSIESVQAVAERLRDESAQAGKRLADRIAQAVPRFEAGEEKRKRREYRLARKAQFRRPEPGFSLYEGRTRGKRIRYTFSDDDETSDAASAAARRSTRPSGISTPAEPAGPTFTASGRQVKPRGAGVYGHESAAGGALPAHFSAAAEANANGETADGTEAASANGRTRAGRAAGRPQRPGPRPRAHIDGYNALDEMEDESDAVSSENSWDGGAEDDAAAAEDDAGSASEEEEDEDDEMSVDGNAADDPGTTEPKSLVVALRVGKERAASIPTAATDSSPAASFDASAQKALPNGTAGASAEPKLANGTLTNGILFGGETDGDSDTVVVQTPRPVERLLKENGLTGHEPPSMAVDS